MNFRNVLLIFNSLPETLETICYLKRGKLQFGIRWSFCFEQYNKAPILSIDKHRRDKVRCVMVLLFCSFLYENTAKTKLLSTKQ